ncbi:MAG: hypothetical protein KH921_09385 [Erysipelotrichaceae bacterium]|nr:hypothetical protein [Erysipelotrichaceae bacterium]
MLIKDEYLEKAYREAAICQVMDELITDGYTLQESTIFDILVVRGNEKKVYEVKIRGSIKRDRDVTRFMHLAKEAGAEPILLYIPMPGQSEIIFDSLGDKMHEYLMNDFPSELDQLSTHTRIQEVCVERIQRIELCEDLIELEGDATITVSLQYGNDHETAEEADDCQSFPMKFAAAVDWNQELSNLNYDVNTSDFYG